MSSKAQINTRQLFFVGIVSSAVFFCLGTDCESAERTAYLLRDDGALATVPLPDRPASPIDWIDPTVITVFDSMVVGSAMATDQRIYTLFPIPREFAAIEPSTGDLQVLGNLDLPIFDEEDLFFQPDGRLGLLFNPSIGVSQLYDIDLDTSATTLLANLSAPFHSIELHNGAYYAGGYEGFWRIDPDTLDMTLITNTIGPWGLASTNEQLWAGVEYMLPGSSATHKIGTIDPISGEFTPYVVLVSQHHSERFFGIEIIEQQTPSIPALQPIGIVVFLIASVAAGVLILRNSQ